MTRAGTYPLPFVVVEWNDAHAPSAGQSVTVEDVHLYHRPEVMHTAGWLLRDDVGGVSLASEYCPSDQSYRAFSFIPSAMIIRVVHFNLTRSRRARAPAVVPPSPGSGGS